jgi:hypothetical protein
MYLDAVVELENLLNLGKILVLNKKNLGLP